MIDDALRELTSGLPILKVKIYNPNGLTVYSSEFGQIGEDKSTNPGFMSSAKTRTTASKFSFRGTFSAFSGVLANRSLVESYVPIIGENAALEGVFELYTDVTPLVDRIERGTVTVVAGLILAFGLLYGTLFLIVRRADHILRRQYATLISNGEDLTAQKESEVADRLRAEHALRASELQLRQSQKMEAIGQLTGGVAHDFNNLLAIVLGNIELLGDQIGQDNRLLQSMQRAATRGAEMTQRLLAFARRQPLQPRAFDLTAHVEGMSDLLQQSLGATIKIILAPADNLWPVRADPGQLENALVNLAINARNAMPTGGELRIELENIHINEREAARDPEATAGDYVMLAVSDTGEGMKPEVLEHAFEPFFTTNEIGKGSGLGLSMVYGFAKQSGGHVTIQSEVQQGTMVALYLPRADQVTEPTEIKLPDQVPQGRGEVILVVEDDEDVRDFVVTVLDGLGYRVIDAPAAAGARVVLEDAEKIDLMVSDVVLPGGVSGPEFAEEVRIQHPDMRVIFMSGFPADASIGNHFVGSHKVLLKKPFRRDQVAQVVRQALDDRVAVFGTVADVTSYGSHS